jgi:hypothetical protein
MLRRGPAWAGRLVIPRALGALDLRLKTCDPVDERPVAPPQIVKRACFLRRRTSMKTAIQTLTLGAWLGAAGLPRVREHRAREAAVGEDGVGRVAGEGPGYRGCYGGCDDDAGGGGVGNGPREGGGGAAGKGAQGAQGRGEGRSVGGKEGRVSDMYLSGVVLECGRYQWQVVALCCTPKQTKSRCL